MKDLFSLRGFACEEPEENWILQDNNNPLPFCVIPILLALHLPVFAAHTAKYLYNTVLFTLFKISCSLIQQKHLVHVVFRLSFSFFLPVFSSISALLCILNSRFCSLCQLELTGQMQSPAPGKEGHPAVMQVGDWQAGKQLCWKDPRVLVGSKLNVGQQLPAPAGKGQWHLRLYEQHSQWIEGRDYPSLLGLIRPHLRYLVQFWDPQYREDWLNWSEFSGGPAGGLGSWSTCPVRRGWELSLFGRRRGGSRGILTTTCWYLRGDGAMLFSELYGGSSRVSDHKLE